MSELVCNYAIARFRPYRETSEFVNVGVVLICPQVSYFGYLFQTRKHKRITDFFPELEVDVFKAGLGGLLKELNRISGRSHEEQLGQLVLREEAHASLARFRELVRPREALFHFAEVATAFTADPQAKLKELFHYYIERQFARGREYQEVIMRRNLGDFLRRVNLDREYRTDVRVGDESYNVVLPFVHLRGTVAQKAIKPLHLDKEGTTEIYRHGDAWLSTVRRLKQINHLPKELLFTIKPPKAGAKKMAAAEEIARELRAQGALTVPFGDTTRLHELARV
jgi:hypothetical protein